jgi:hypothetical protein
MDFGNKFVRYNTLHQKLSSPSVIQTSRYHGSSTYAMLEDHASALYDYSCSLPWSPHHSRAMVDYTSSFSPDWDQKPLQISRRLWDFAALKEAKALGHGTMSSNSHPHEPLEALRSELLSGAQICCDCGDGC